MRYEIKLQLSTELDIEVVKKALQSVGVSSGNVEHHWVRTQELTPVGRPREIVPQIRAYIESVDYPKSTKQIGAALKRAPESLYRSLYAMVADGTLEVLVDERWRTKRFGLPDQVRKWNERNARRLAKQDEARGRTQG